MEAARRELDALRSELAFEQISLVITDNGLHWQFYFGARHLADYWPASGKGQRIGTLASYECGSVAQAQKLAVAAKNELFSEIAKALQRRSAGPEPVVEAQSEEP